MLNHFAFIVAGTSPATLPPLWRRRDIWWNRADGAAQLGAQFLRNKAGIHAVANDLRADEDDQYGSAVRFVLVREDVAQILNLIEQRNAAAVEILLLLNQARQQHRLAARDPDRALDLSLREGRIAADAVRILNLADLLFDIEPHVAVGVDARHHTQDNADAAVVDGVDDAPSQRGQGAGRDRHIAADHQGRHLVVDDDNRWIRQHLGGGHGVQGIENHIRRGFRAEQEIETWKRPIEGGIEQAVRASGHTAARRRGRYVGHRATHAALLALEKELHAVGEIVV